MSTENPDKKLIPIEEQLAAGELSPEELEKVGGGLTDASGRWLTTIAFGCAKWTASDKPWQAVQGQCGSCKHWIIVGSRGFLNPCEANVEPR
ncbi:MAG: hypothetical protein ACOX2K_03180 [Bacillota bacterium]|jgi:hypothetical protein